MFLRISTSVSITLRQFTLLTSSPKTVSYLVALAALMFRVTHPNGQNNTTKNGFLASPKQNPRVEFVGIPRQEESVYVSVT